MRARTHFEEFGQNRTRIIVTELPYQVNKRQLIRAIADQVKDKRIEGISDLRDETDREGMRMVIELKRDANPQVVLNSLFANTSMQSTFAVNMLALVDNQKQPKILSLRHMLDEYLKFQEEIIVRRTKYDLKKAMERAHLLEGLLVRKTLKYTKYSCGFPPFSDEKSLARLSCRFVQYCLRNRYAAS